MEAEIELWAQGFKRRHRELIDRVGDIAIATISVLTVLVLALLHPPAINKPLFWGLEVGIAAAAVERANRYIPGILGGFIAGLGITAAGIGAGLATFGASILLGSSGLLSAIISIVIGAVAALGYVNDVYRRQR